MKFFTNKKFLFKLIATLCVCLTIFNFGLAPKAEAGFVSWTGGKLLDPVCDLLSAIADGIMEVMQKSIMGIGSNLIFDKVGSTIGGILKTAFKAIIAVVLAVVATAALATLVAGIPYVGAFIAAGITSGIARTSLALIAFSVVSSLSFADEVVLPTYYLGPEEIFSGEILLLDPNIFQPRDLYVELENGDIKTATEWSEEDNKEKISKYFYYRDKNPDNKSEDNIVVTSANNAAYELKNVVAKWYYVIRNIAIVGLMLVLLYVGIRMLISSIAAEKAKYKQMLSDWVIALCLVFLMQYIMVFANSFVDSIIQILATTSDSKGYIEAIEDKDGILGEKIKEDSPELYESMQNPDGADGYLYWNTNLTGKARIEAQKHDGSVEYVGYTLCYVVLVLYTIFFIFTYLRRLLYLLFLTVISPFVALTYPLDKIRDGQAQAFNMWLKEYIFNLLIQPFHLLLYVIFVNMAFELSGTNIIYSLVVIGFMIPAEKFLRSMFGFDKAKTPGFLAGPAGAAMTISAVQSLAKYAGGGKKSLEGKSQDIQKSLQRGNNPGKTVQSAINALIGHSSEDNNSENAKEKKKPTVESVVNDSIKTGKNAASAVLKTAGSGLGLAAGVASGATSQESQEGYPKDESNRLTPEEQARIEKLEKELDEAYDEGDANMYINRDDLLAKQEELERLRNKNILDSRKQEEKPQIKRPNKFVARMQAYKSDKFTIDKLVNDSIKTGKSVAKFGLGAAGAGLGIAAGISSGSPGEAIKYGTSAAYAGSAIAGGTANRVEVTIKDSIEREQQLQDEALKIQYTPAEYKEIVNKKKDDKYAKSKKTRDFFDKELGLNGDETKINEAVQQARTFREWGIDDDKIIVKIMKDADKRGENRVSEENIATGALAMNIKSNSDLEKAMNRLSQTKGIKEDQVTDMRNRLINATGL